MRNRLLAACLVIACLPAQPSSAQDGGPDVNNVRVRLGPLMMNPTISITNIGIDHNVFNDPPTKSPKEDFTATVTPLTDFWLHLGPTWVTASMNEAITWYKKYATERTANSEYKLGWNVPGSVIGFKIDWDYLNARERPGFEIVGRVGHKDVTYTGSVDYKALSKTFIGVNAARTRTRFADEAEFLEVKLNTSLNRTSTLVGINLRHDLTPLTRVTFSAARTMDRFEFSSDRDSVSMSGTGALSFSPGALFQGGLSIGYTNFKPSDPALPDYSGVIGKVDLTYVLLGSTRFAIQASRGVKYSFDVNQPYYVETGFSGSFAQQIFGPFDVAVRGGLDTLAYRDRAGAAVQVSDRADHVVSYGVGIGFHMGKDLRLSFNLDKVNRDSKIDDRKYDNYRFGTALTYGFVGLGT